MNVDENAARERWRRDVLDATMGVGELAGIPLADWLWKMSGTSAFQLSPQQMKLFVEDWKKTNDELERLGLVFEKLRENLQDAEKPR